MERLLPCPFCGGEADEYEGEYGNGIYCMECGAMVGEPIHLGFDIAERVSYEQAVEAWNTRAGCKNCAALNRAAGLWAKADKRARELERACRMSPSDYYPCAEDDCMRLKVRMWTCSECEADYVGNKPNYCPNCGAKVVD